MRVWAVCEWRATRRRKSQQRVRWRQRSCRDWRKVYEGQWRSDMIRKPMIKKAFEQRKGKIVEVWEKSWNPCLHGRFPNIKGPTLITFRSSGPEAPCRNRAPVQNRALKERFWLYFAGNLPHVRRKIEEPQTEAKEQSRGGCRRRTQNIQAGDAPALKRPDNTFTTDKREQAALLTRKFFPPDAVLSDIRNPPVPCLGEAPP